MKTIIRVVICLLMIFILNSATYYALDVHEYKYTSSKQNKGLAYELLNVSFDDKNIKFNGWAYNSDTQHYSQANDIKIDIIAIGDGVDFLTLDSKITDEYNLTPIEHFEGKPDCGVTEYYKDNSVCNYDYKYVTFDAKMELEKFNPKYEYEFYLFVESKNSNTKRYTKLYSPGINIEKENETKKYEFSSNLDENEIKVNVNQVLIRRAAGKHSAPYYANSHYYYYKADEIFNPTAKKNIGPITWYKVKFNPTLEKYSGHMLGIASNGSKTGYIPSNFVDYLGYGNSKLKIKTKSDVEILNVATHTIDENKPYINLKLKFTDIKNNVGYQVEIIHSQGVTVYNGKTSKEYEELNLSIPKNQIKGGKITVRVSFIDAQQKDETNSVVTFDPFYSQEQEIEIKVEKNQNTTKIKIPSGVEINEKRKEIIYYETIILNYSPPIENIQGALSEYDQATGYYAGGAFSSAIKITRKDDYPYRSPYGNESIPNIEINCSVFDFNNCESKKIDMEKIDDIFVLPKTYMGGKGDVHLNVQTDSIYPNGRHAFYTKQKLTPGKYLFTITVPTYGVNNNSYKIETYLNVRGNLFGEGEGDYFYIRNVNKINLMPDFVSEIWSNSMNKLKNLSNDTFEPKVKITITKEAKQEINDWTKEDFQTNINGNNEEFESLLEELVQQEKITITK